MKTKIHAFVGVIGFLTIATFWSSTLFVELAGSKESIITVKNSILWGMLLLIPCMAIAGASGMSLAKGRTDSGVLLKKKRMPFIAFNGLFVLVPSAIFLASKANADEFDAIFYIIQSVELIAGATNLTLIGLNIRDGLRVTGKIANSNQNSKNGRSVIEIRKNGPIVVSGLKSFIGIDQQSISTKPVIALCRCGASKNKPYCDGSHSKENFSDEKMSDRTTDKIISYKGKEINIKYNRLLCSKAGKCSQKLKQVFDVSRDPWIDPDQGSITEIIDVVGECPSGALSYSQSGKKIHHVVSNGSLIEIEKNGPYLVRNVKLNDAEWCEGACEDKFSLCRCGASKNKPYCDGTHTGTNFSD